MAEPMNAEQYAAALADLDAHISNVDTSGYGSLVDDGVRVEQALLGLTEAVLAVAKGVRLLAEPPTVDTVAAPGTFGLLLTDDEKAEDGLDPR